MPRCVGFVGGNVCRWDHRQRLWRGDLTSLLKSQDVVSGDDKGFWLVIRRKGAFLKTEKHYSSFLRCPLGVVWCPGTSKIPHLINLYGEGLFINNPKYLTGDNFDWTMKDRRKFLVLQRRK
jgi:hypothetical protein